MAALVTKRERVLRTARFMETDRVPIFEIFTNEALIEHFTGEPLTTGEHGSRLKGLAIGRALDMTGLPDGPRQPALVRQPNGLVIQQEHWTRWVEFRPFSDTASTVEWVKMEIERTREQAFDRAYASQAQAEMRQRLGYFAEGDPDHQNDPAVLALDSGVGMKEMLWMVGQERFIRLMEGHPALVEEWLEARNRAEIARANGIADPQLAPVVMLYDDISAGAGIPFSSDWLREHWLPHLKRLVDAWRQRDTFCLFRSNGNLAPFIADLVSAGIDGLHLSDIQEGMTVREVRQRYPRLFLTGGIDSRQLLSYGLPEEVREACRDAVRATHGLGYFIGSTQGLNWEARTENALAMLERVEPPAHPLKKRRF